MVSVSVMSDAVQSDPSNPAPQVLSVNFEHISNSAWRVATSDISQQYRFSYISSDAEMQKEHFPSADKMRFPWSLKISYQESANGPMMESKLTTPLPLNWRRKHQKEKYRGVIDGMPAWIDIPPPTHEEITYELEKQQLINQANEYMNGKQWPGKAAIGRLKDEELG